MAKSKVLMKVDVVPFTHMIVAFCIGAVVLIISLIIGGCGPESKTHFETFAYDCPNASHTWSEECHGVRPGIGDIVVVETPALRSESRFWALTAKPFNKKLQKGHNTDVEILVDLLLVINVSSRKTFDGEWSYEIKNDMRTVTVKCPSAVKGDQDVPCHSVTVSFEEAIDSPFHRVEMGMIMVNHDDDANVELGDVSLTLSYGTETFALFGVVFNVIFLLVSLGVFLFYLYSIRTLLFRDWSFEQAWALLLVLAVIFYNNPLFALEYAAPGWFFPFVDALFKDLFLSLLLIFWLISVEKYRDLDEFNWNDKKHGIKVIVAAVFFIFAVITFSVSAGEIRRNPVLASPFEVPAVVVLYVITVLILVGAVIWYVVIAIFAVPKIAHSAVLFTRFLFLSIPAGVIVLSVLIGACSGNFGTVNTSASNSLDTAYFITLFNVFTWVLVYGFWPTESRFDAGNATIIEEDSVESKPFLRSDNADSADDDAVPSASASSAVVSEEKPAPETVA